MSTTNKTKQSFLGRLFGQKPMPDVPPTREAIQEWLVNRLATHLSLSPEEIDVSETLSNYGLDSRTAVGLSGDLERWLRRPLSPTLAWDYPTIEQMAKFLTTESEAAADEVPANGTLADLPIASDNGV